MSFYTITQSTPEPQSYEAALEATTDLAVEVVTLPATEEDTATDAIENPFVLEDGFEFAFAEFGDILMTPENGATLTGTTAGDIFLLWEGERNIAVRAGPGGDIVLAWDGSGSLNMGTGGDIADVMNWTGSINLGADQEGDVALITLGDASLDGRVTVTNFNPELDVVLVYGDDVTEADTAAGLVYSWQGEAVVLISGYHPDWIV